MGHNSETSKEKSI